ncbi:MAG TPA: hypothetical protein VGY53_01060, partial [Isosphaeraceae bacterium]|nr:hypothetical protein [Isosphaeraceae bacterium]
ATATTIIKVLTRQRRNATASPPCDRHARCRPEPRHASQFVSDDHRWQEHKSCRLIKATAMPHRAELAPLN